MPGTIVNNQPANGTLQNDQFNQYTLVNFGVPYIELEGYSEHFGEGVNESTRYLACAWPDRAKFLYGMLGDCATNGSMIRRVLPDQHPEYPELYCAECELVGRRGQISQYAGKLVYIDGGRPGYAGAAVYRCLYRAPDYQVLADGAVTSELQRFVSRYATFTNEALPLPPAFLAWDSDGALIPESPAKAFFGAEVTYLWRQVPLVPFPTIQKTLGKVNDADFDTGVGGTGLVKETALFIGFDPQRVRGGNRGVMFNITYKFLVKTGDPANTEGQPTWNKLYRRGTGHGKWEAIVVAATGAKPYPAGDMNKLFQMA